MQPRRKKGRKGEVVEWIHQVADAPKVIWSLDFAFNSLEDVSPLKILTIDDHFTQECLLLEPATSLPASRIIKIFDREISEPGTPRYLG